MNNNASKCIPDATNIRTVQTLIDEAKALGMRVVYRHESPNQSALANARQQSCVSPEAA